MMKLTNSVLISTFCILCFVLVGFSAHSWSCNSMYHTAQGTIHNSDFQKPTVSCSDTSIEEILIDIREYIIKENACWTAEYTSVFNPNVSIYDLGLGCILEEVQEDNNGLASSSVSLPPSSFDWRYKEGIDWTTPVRNQLSCGSCVAFGAIGALEAVVQIELGQLLDIDLSEAHLFYCGGGSCSHGWTISKAINQIMEVGVAQEDCFPYTPHQTDCDNVCPDWQDQSITIIEGHRIRSSNNITAIQQALIDYGPLITSFTVYQDFMAYSSGIYQHVYGEAVGGHAVTIVGYNNDEEYWICKNSWGKNWGEQGYFRIRFKECGLGSSFNTYYLSGAYGGICEEYLPKGMRNPSPVNGEAHIPANITLHWLGGDPNSEDMVWYEIYFGKSEKPNLIDIIGPFPSTLESISYKLDNLEIESRYYWQIIAVDSHGGRRLNPILYFTTIDTNPPLLEIFSPMVGYMYKMDGNFRKQIPSSSAIVFGSLNVELTAIDNGSGLKQVDIFIDSINTVSLTEEPFRWIWKSRSFKKHTLKVIAIDFAGNENVQTLEVWKIF